MEHGGPQEKKKKGINSFYWNRK